MAEGLASRAGLFVESGGCEEEELVTPTNAVENKMDKQHLRELDNSLQ